MHNPSLRNQKSKQLHTLLILITLLLLLPISLFSYGVSSYIPKPSNAIDVTTPPYNAPNNNTTDASFAINRAIKDAAQNSKSVWIPRGTYKLNRILIVHSGSKIHLDRNAIMRRNHNHNGGMVIYNEVGTSNVLIRGGTFTRNNKDGDRIITVHGNNWTLDNIKVIQFQNFAFWIRGNNHVVKNCTIRGQRDTHGDDGIHFLRGQNFLVDNCSVSAGDDAVGIFPPKSEDAYIRDVTIQNSYLVSEGASCVGVGIFPEMQEQGGIIDNVNFINLKGHANGVRGVAVVRVDNFSKKGGKVKNITFDKVNFHSFPYWQCPAVVMVRNRNGSIVEHLTIKNNCRFTKGKIGIKFSGISRNNHFTCSNSTFQGNRYSAYGKRPYNLNHTNIRFNTGPINLW